MVEVPSVLAVLAQGAAPSAGAGIGQMLVLFVPMILIMYFFLIRPQQRRQKQHEAMLKALQPGDKVVTTGGIVGTVTKVEEAEGTVRLRIAPSVEISIVRSYVAGKPGEGEKAP